MEDFIKGLMVTTAIGFLLFYAICRGITINGMGTKKYDTEQYIYSLGDSTGVSGKFLLGMGSVREEWQYVFYYQTENGFSMGQVDADDYFIIEDNSVKPQTRIVTKCLEETQKVLIFKFGKGACSFFPSHEIVVPTNSIKQEYNLDLNK